MRITSLQLSWFRGAADPVALDVDCKSMVVYGQNGSGKSSFVDAVEYVIRGGKIGHLTHEYSGRRQEKGIRNTHTPPNRQCELTIKFNDGSPLEVKIDEKGVHSSSGAESAAIVSWDYRRTVLRQDEVAEFVHQTKGDKYSALLPLLGLHEIEVAAENLRRLARSIESESKLSENRTKLSVVNEQRAAVFGTVTDDEILDRITHLHAKYCVDNIAVSDVLHRRTELEFALDQRIKKSSADLKRHIAILGIAEVGLKQQIEAVRNAKSKLADAVEPLIEEKLRVLETAATFADKVGDWAEVQCPACGQTVPVDAFQSHIVAEHERLQNTIRNFESLKAAIATLCDVFKSMKSNLGKTEVKSWRDELVMGPLSENVAYLDRIDPEDVRKSCETETLTEFDTTLLPLIDVATQTTKDAPPDASLLSNDKRTVEAAKMVMESYDLAASVRRAETLLCFIKAVEQGTRDEIRLQSRAAIKIISADIQVMWDILHPEKPIDNVELYLHPDADKAIDIRLRFHGVVQDSPRLSLSEGYRNSLGVCIFLAMAKRDAQSDRPIFLDDVVVSLDRNHRGMIAELLTKQFSDRQVIIFTHDREWYTELRQQLDDKAWRSKTLLPYESPEIGIRWSHKTTTFDDARAHLKVRPDSAGNDARKIMDVELALIAERLKIKLPYLRADRNDKRMAHEFLERFIADGKKCFQKKVGKDYSAHVDAISAFENADRFIVSWANRASHSQDLVRSEAAKLIEACEKSLESFRCDACEKNVWYAEVTSSESTQCHCGEIRWRYGKS